MTKGSGVLARRSLPLLAVVCAMCVLVLGPSSASANTIIVGPAPVVTPDGLGWKWSYDATLTSAGFSAINIGDGFTIYDFSGLDPLSVFAPINWITSVTTGTSGSGGNFGPNGLLYGSPNITFTWNGMASITTLGFLGTFGATSEYNGAKVGDYGAEDQGALGAQNNNGLTLVPTPEPGTLILLGSGLLGAVRAARKRRSA